jgi:general stress protein 26
MSTESQQQFEDLIDSFDNAMLVTQTKNGNLRSRPMALALREKSGDMFFATKADSGKIDEILHHPGVNVSMQSNSAYLSVSGQAELINDQKKVEELWQPGWKRWFEEGKSDPSIVLIKVHATQGEYWNFDTADKLNFLFEAGKAVITGDTIDYDQGDHAKVKAA